MNKKRKYIIIGAAMLFILLCVIMFQYIGKTVIIEEDTTINSNFTITSGQHVTLKNGAKLTIIGNMFVNGTLSCDDGPLFLSVRDSLTVTGKINCALTDSTLSQRGIAITIAAKHMLFDKSTELSANGHIDLVTTAGELLSSGDERSRVYKETGEDTGTSPRVGPFREGGSTQKLSSGIKDTILSHKSPYTKTQEMLPENRFIKIAEARSLSNNVPSMIIGGTWFIGDKKILPSGLSIPTPPKNAKEVLLYIDVGEEGTITLQDLHLIGASGGDGNDDIEKNCTALGANGENAFRVRVNAGNIDLNTVQIELGGGGRGGNAETAKDCFNAVAQGGAGGEAGNLKMTAAKNIEILDFTITPGRGGSGGNAIAFARNGENSCPGGDGGDAMATGGAGQNNKKELATAGNVMGLNNIKTGRVIGGSGGNAAALPGKGGNAMLCGCKGGRGGNANAIGGKGGDAWAAVPVGTIEGHGGDGGSADTRGASGGNGGSCSLAQTGGDGGAGGNAKAEAGLPGKGLTASGNKGVIKNQGGGSGGSGGDGCPTGIGGQGGIGAPIGTRGPLGKNICPNDKKNPPQPEVESTLIEAILYQGKYLPIDQLIVEQEAGCDAEHWRALRGTVKATDDSIISDPTVPCGFGKVKENQPEMVEKSVEHIKFVHPEKFESL